MSYAMRTRRQTTRPSGLLFLGLAGCGILISAPVSSAHSLNPAASDNIQEDIEFARGLATDWQFVDLAQGVLASIPTADLDAEGKEQLELTSAEVVHQAALATPDPGLREERFVEALDGYRNFLGTYTNSTFTERAQRSYVDVGSIYGQDMASRIEDTVGEERERMLKEVEEQLTQVARFAGEIVDGMTGVDLSPAEKQIFYRMSLAQGQILLILGGIVEDGSYYLGRGTEAMEALGYGAGVETGWGMSAFNVMARLEAAKGNPDTAAEVHLYVVRNLIGASAAEWEERKEFIDASALPRVWIFYEREAAPLVESLQAAGRDQEALDNGLRFYNMLQQEGLELSPSGYLGLLAVGRAMVDLGGFVGGSEAKGDLAWYPTTEELEAAGVSKRDRQSAVEVALNLATRVNAENRGSFLQVRAQQLISDIVSTPGVVVSAETLFEAAQGSYLARDYTDAIAGLRRVIPALEDDAERRLMMPKILWHMGAALGFEERKLEAAMAFRSAILNWRGDEEYDSRNANSYYSIMNGLRKELPDATEIQSMWRDAEDFKQSLGSGGAEDIAWRRGNNALTAGNFAGARQQFAGITPDSAYYEPGLVRAARALQQDGDLDGSEAELLDYLENYTQDPKNRLGTQDGVQRQQRKAAVEEAEFFVGDIAFEREDWAGVIERLAQYSGPDGYALQASTYLVEAASSQNDIQGAIRFLDEMLEAYPDSPLTGKSALDLYNALLPRESEQAEALAAALEDDSVDEEQLRALSAPLRETRTRMAETLRVANKSVADPTFIALRNEANLWFEIEFWEEAVGTFTKLEEAFGEDGSDKERNSIERSIAPDHASALLELKRVQEAFDLLSPLIQERGAEGSTPPTAGAIMAYGRAVGGWPEGDPSNPTIVPGVGTPEDFSKAVQWTQRLAAQYDRFEGDWWPTQAQLGMLYLSWGRLDSSKREFAKKQLVPIHSSFGPTYRDLAEQLGDEQMAGYFKWMWSQAN